MSKNINQIYIANPITSNAGTDLMYFGQSPYGVGNDAAMLYSNFSAQFAANVLTTKGDLYTFSTVNARLAVGTVNGQMLQVNSAATTGLAWSTATFPATTTINQLLYSSSANTVVGLATANNGVLFTSAGGIPSIGTAPVVAGGTGVTSVTTSPTATSFSGWDANKNLSANSFISGYRTTPTAGATTTLVVGDAYQQYFTGATTQTVVMPVTSTLVLGQQYFINNLSSGVVTVQSSGGNTIQAMAANTTLTLTCILTSGTTAASWNAEYVLDTAITLPLSLTNGGTNAALTANNGGIVWSNATQLQILNGTATANQLLLSGATATPAWSTSTHPTSASTAGKVVISDGTNWVMSTPTYPNTSGTSGKFLISDGTNNVYSTSTIPSSAGATANKIVLSDGTNYVLSTPTFPNASASSGKFIRSDGTNWIASTPTLPTSAGTSGKILQSDGTNYVESTPTYPSTSGTARKIIVSDGTNNVYSTETYATPGTSGNVMTSDGTNWTSSAPTYIKWNDVSGTTQTAAINNGYVISNAGQTTVTLPTTAAEGSVFSIAGKGAAGWILQGAAGQTIHLGSSATSVAGNLTSTNQWDSVSIVCVTANTTFTVTSVIGNLTVA